MTIAEPTIHRFTRRENYRMADAGVFDQQRVELINGEILDMSPQNEPHALAVSLINALLHRLVPAHYTIRCQLPLWSAIPSAPSRPASCSRPKQHAVTIRLKNPHEVPA